MSSGLYSGVSGLALGTGLYKDTSGLWGGASGLIDGFGFGNPTLDLNFLPMSTLPSTVTFSRGTNATLVDATGRLTYAPNNLLTNSESFEAAAWTKTGATVTANSTAAPDETLTADSLVEDTSAGFHRVFATPACAANTRYTYTAYLKASGRTQARLLETTLGGATFDLSNGTVVSTDAGVTSSIQFVGNGWYRCAITATTGASQTTFVAQVQGVSGGGNSYVGNGATAMFLWGAQLEAVTYQTTPGAYNSTTPKNLLGFTQEFDNAAWTKSNSFVQTNLLTYSQDFDNAAWLKNVVTVTANSAAAPDGTTTADLLTSSGDANIRQGATCAANTAYTGSVWLRVTSGSANINLYRNDNGTGFSTTVAAVTTTWQRFTITATTSGTATTAFLQIGGGGTLPNGATLLVWGAQLVQGATAGDYQPTYAAAAAVQYAAPDGTLSADKLVETATNTTHRTFGTVTTAAVSYTYSVYLKAAERTWAYLRIDRNGGTNPQAWFNLSTGAIGTVQTGLTASIQSAGNGWYRCAVTIDAAAAGTANPLVGVATANAVDTYAGDGTSGIFVWGAQLSNSASLDPYVYNPAAAPTSAAFFGPRFDFDPVTLAPRGLLMEMQRTNLFTRSEEFDTATWNKSGATVTANTIVSPDGTVDADALVENNATSSHFCQQFFTGFTSGVAYTMSVYVKPETRTFVEMFLPSAAFGVGQGGYFNLSGAGSLGNATGTPTSRTITAVGNGWYRITVTATATATAGGNCVIAAASANGTTSYAGNSSTAFHLYGAQLEAGAFATSYIPTVASQVTRTADVATMLGDNFASWFNAAAGTLLVEASVVAINQGTNSGGLASIDDSTNSNRAMIFQSGTGVTSALNFSGTGFTTNNATTVSANTPFKAALAYAVGTSQGILVVNGNLGSPSNPTGTFAPTRLSIGAGVFAGIANGHIRSIRYFPTRLSNTQLQAITV